MTRDEAMRKIAKLHQEWSLAYSGKVRPVEADRRLPSGEAARDYAMWRADRSAPASIDDPLNDAIEAILAQIEE